MSDTEPGLKGTWMIDPAHSRIGFSGRHAMISTVRGAFNELEGEFYADPHQHHHRRDPRRAEFEISAIKQADTEGVEDQPGEKTQDAATA